MYKKFSYFTKKGRFGRIIWTAAVLLIISLFMGSGAMKSIYESGQNKLESTMSILKVIVGLHAIWFGYLGFYDFFNFYFSVKKKISGLVQIIFGIAVILQVYFATLSIFDLIGLSNMPDIHNLSTFEGLNNFKFVFLSLAFSIVTYFIRSYVEKGEYDLRMTIDARM